MQQHVIPPICRIRLSLFLVAVSLSPLMAQTDRIVEAIESRPAVVLKGNRHPKAQPRFDQGPTAPSRRLTGLTLMLKPSQSQRAALQKLLEEQQDPASPNYHNWLTPEQYAERFGLSTNDLSQIVAWLRSRGFDIDYQARGRTWVSFSGTAESVQAAFLTEIHDYWVDGERHFAAAAEPSVPAALEPVVLGIQGLDDFPLSPPGRRPPSLSRPNFNFDDGSHALAPGDIQTIYNLRRLYQNGITGAGQKIAVAGQTNIVMSDIRSFRSRFGLPKNDPQVILVPGDADPGISSAYLGEADLDIEWSGAVARDATVLYVYSPNVWNAVQYAVNQNLAPVIGVTYSQCEPKGAVFLASWLRSIAQQGNAQGITLVGASGDRGAADCDDGVGLASQGLAVGLPASIPEVTGVGGTAFSQEPGRYWSSVNASDFSSALSYIPEVAWNDTSAFIDAGQGLAASGGGASILFPKPSWQVGPGVPNDSARDVPDVSLAASQNAPYAVFAYGDTEYMLGTSASAPVFAGIVALLNQYVVSTGSQPKAGLGNINPTLYRLAQTAPAAFHDITAGYNIVPCTVGTPDCTSGQFGYGAGPGYDLVTGLGSVDAYALATAWTAAPSVSTTTTVTANPTSIPSDGSTVLTATVKAASGTTSPTGSVSFTLGTSSLGSAALAGSGGSATASLTVNGSQLAVGSNAIAASYAGSGTFGASSASVTVTVTGPAIVATTTTLTANPTSITTTGSTVLTATVKAASGTVSPTGSVSFARVIFMATISLGSATLSGSGGSATASLTVNGSQLALGSNTITASYAGNTTFGASSASVSVTVGEPASTTSSVVPSVVPNPVFQQDADADGYSWFYTLRLSEIAGVATTLVGFTIDGADYSPQIASWFGSASLPANGTLSTSLRSRRTSVPSTSVYVFSGADASGATWTQQVSLPFRGKQSAATLALSSSPGTEIQDPNGDPACPGGYPFHQQLNLQEQSGYEVALTRYLDGGNDDSSAIVQWFGSWRLAPFGALQAQICWSVSNLPQTLSYEIDGVDSAGNTVQVTASVPFQGPGQNSGALSATPASVTMTAASSQSATAAVAVNVPSGQQWTVTVFPSSQKTSWLTVFPQSGAGPANLNLVASAAGLGGGVYTATLVIESTNTFPQFIDVPVQLTAGASSTISISGVGNGASFRQAFAPGMLMSVFGSGLANSTETAGVPLPTTLSGVSAAINGVPCPLLYISPVQLNLQVPYGTPTGSALLTVNNNGHVASTTFKVGTSAPGIFTGSGDRLVPSSTAARGQAVEMFITGEGDVTPFVATGALPFGVALTQPPRPRLPLTVTVGGVPVDPLYVGIPSWSVGVTQVNFRVPPGISLGAQPVVVTVGGVASQPATLAVQETTANVQFTFTPASVNQSSDGRWYYSLQLQETNGVGVTLTRLVIDDNDCTSSIAKWFGSTYLPPGGQLKGDFTTSCTCTPPWDGHWDVTGSDDNGHAGLAWKGVVHFLPAASSSINTVVSGLSPAAKGLAVDSGGNIYHAEGNSIKKASQSGAVSVIAGNGTAGFSGDGGQAASAQLNSPSGVAVDRTGRVYIADYSNGRIRRVDVNGTISTFAGNGQYAESGDGGPAANASFSEIQNVVVDPSGNVYVVTALTVRRIDQNGIVSTVAGDPSCRGGGYSGDGGPAVKACLHTPDGVAFDGNGYLYISDNVNARIRKVDQNGIITTVAGNGSNGYSGDGGSAVQAAIGFPSGIAVGLAGNVLFSSCSTQRIRQVSTDGIVTTVAGTGVAGFAGDSGTPDTARLNCPTNLALGTDNALYVLDSGNLRIRRIILPASQ